MSARLVVLAMLCAPSAAAQQSVRVEVRDDQGTPVGFAHVSPVGGAAQVATDSGVVTFRMRAADSLNLRVRRIGYREHFGWVGRGEGGTYRVTLPRVAAMLSTVEVTAAGSSSNTPLVQRGFYDRVDRVQKGAIVGDFFTPEQLDERQGFTKVTQMIARSRYARVNSMPVRDMSRVLVIVGRGGAGFAPPSIDDVVDGRSIMAIEVYPSTGNAPSELQRASGRGSCGIVALWTGARR